ncbi:MAG: M50 family metallopeptidase [Candidatus Obscuribacterales bacterium]|nr:M50 family metallopeptidase [Candidatus Obscuribacterales bacterium]
MKTEAAAVWARTTFSTTKTFAIIIGFVVLSMILREVPLLGLILQPLETFETAVHEMGHALACIATGGFVDGLTIVDDGEGHGGLTYCKGGWPLIYSQAGYIGEALFGSTLILLSRFQKLSRAILIFLGVAIGLGAILLMPGTIIHEGDWKSGLMSMLSGLLIAGAFVFSGAKLKDKWAHLLLLFIAVQSSLSSLSGIWVLLLQSFGMFPGTWSDATNMEKMTHIPAFLWGIGWAIFSIGSLAGTMWLTYQLDKMDQKKVLL